MSLPRNHLRGIKIYGVCIKSYKSFEQAFPNYVRWCQNEGRRHVDDPLSV